MSAEGRGRIKMILHVRTESMQQLNMEYTVRRKLGLLEIPYKITQKRLKIEF